MTPRHPKCRNCHTESASCPKSKMTTVSRNETFENIRPFQKIIHGAKFTKYCACHAKWPPKPSLILAHACHTRMNWCPMSYTCHAKRSFRPQNAPAVPHLPHEMNIASKTNLRKSHNCYPHFVRACAIKMHMDTSPSQIFQWECFPWIWDDPMISNNTQRWGLVGLPTKKAGSGTFWSQPGAQITGKSIGFHMEEEAMKIWIDTTALETTYTCSNIMKYPCIHLHLCK